MHRDNLPLLLPHKCGAFFPERAAGLQHSGHFWRQGWQIIFQFRQCLLSSERILQARINSGCRVARGINFVLQCLVSVVHQCETRFVSLFWRLEFWGGYWIFGEFVDVDVKYTGTSVCRPIQGVTNGIILKIDPASDRKVLAHYGCSPRRTPAVCVFQTLRL